MASLPTFNAGTDPTAAQWQALLPGHARKTADQLLASNTTFQNDNTLFVSVAANATYKYELKILIRSDNATNGGMKVQFTIPASASMPWTMFRWASNAAPQLTGTNGQVTGLTLTTSNVFYEEEGELAVGGTAGTFQFQWAQNGSSAANTIVAANSFLLLRQVA